MEPVKISLADAAKTRGCSVDYLLALAEAGQIKLYGRIGPCAWEFKNRRGEPPSVTQAYASRVLGELDVRKPPFPFEGPPAAECPPLVISGLTTVGEPTYTTLLPHEASILRTGKTVMVRVVHQPGDENGVRFPFSGDEEFCLHLTEPQEVGVDQVCMIEGPPAMAPTPVQKPVPRSVAQDEAIVAELLALGLNPQALPVAEAGLAGVRAKVYASMDGRDAQRTRSIFSSQKVFETAWQRLRNAGTIRDAAPTPAAPQKKRGAPGA